MQIVPTEQPDAAAAEGEEEKTMKTVKAKVPNEAIDEATE